MMSAMAYLTALHPWAMFDRMHTVMDAGDVTLLETKTTELVCVAGAPLHELRGTIAAADGLWQRLERRAAAADPVTKVYKVHLLQRVYRVITVLSHMVASMDLSLPPKKRLGQRAAMWRVPMVCYDGVSSQ